MESQLLNHDQLVNRYYNTIGPLGEMEPPMLSAPRNDYYVMTWII